MSLIQQARRTTDKILYQIQSLNPIYLTLTFIILFTLFLNLLLFYGPQDTTTLLGKTYHFFFRTLPHTLTQILCMLNEPVWFDKLKQTSKFQQIGIVESICNLLVFQKAMACYPNKQDCFPSYTETCLAQRANLINFLYLLNIYKYIFRTCPYLQRYNNYIKHKNHPFIQIFYLILSIGGFTIYILYGVNKYMPNYYITQINIWFMYVMAGLCYWSYYIACITECVEVGKDNFGELVQKYKQYYDGIIFTQKNICKTCKITKPALSKHCPICNICISKADHHCPWIRQCIGEKNRKHFIIFIILHAVWCLYLAYIGIVSLWAFMQKIKYKQTKFQLNGRIVQGNQIIMGWYFVNHDMAFIFVILVAIIAGLALAKFGIYHLLLVKNNLTTNQKQKVKHKLKEFEHQREYIGKILQQYRDDQQIQSKYNNNDKIIIYKESKFSYKQMDKKYAQLGYKIEKLRNNKKNVKNLGFIANLKQIINQ